MKRWRDRRKDSQPSYAPHPRYGTGLQYTNLSVREEDLKASYWRFRDETLFPETALRANTTAQGYAVFPRPFYVDILKTCRDCDRQFIFYAREQKYWFETLGFWIDADCVRCAECRLRRRRIDRVRRRFGERRRLPNPDAGTLRRLVEDALFLLRERAIVDLQKVAEVKNRALRELPNEPVTRQLTHALLQARRVEAEIERDFINRD